MVDLSNGSCVAQAGKARAGQATWVFTRSCEWELLGFLYNIPLTALEISGIPLGQGPAPNGGLETEKSLSVTLDGVVS